MSVKISFYLLCKIQEQKYLKMWAETGGTQTKCYTFRLWVVLRYHSEHHVSGFKKFMLLEANLYI